MSFNPYRVFKFAATLWCRWIWLFAFRFQSLSGFQVRCNDLVACDFTQHEVGFNPYRVFKFAATSFQHFSIIWKLRFNPYRVFKFAATLVLRLGGSFGHSFNPYRVFKFAATWWEPWRAGRVVSCFNPYRVFKFAATQRCHHERLLYGLVSIPIGFSSSLQPDVGPWFEILRFVSIPIGFSSSLQRG